METTQRKGRGSDKRSTGNRRNCGRKPLGELRLVCVEVYLPIQFVELFGGRKECADKLNSIISANVGNIPTEPLPYTPPLKRFKNTLVRVSIERLHLAKFAGENEMEKKNNFRLWVKLLFNDLV